MGFYRRKLPHLQRDDKRHFVTFCTFQRWVLPEQVRSIVLGCCLHDNDLKHFLHAAVIMPDHVHLIFTPLVNTKKSEIYCLAEIMGGIKGASAQLINLALNRQGRVWQTESFDRVLRSSESLDAKIAYIMENPVRAGLVSQWGDYPWIWVRREGGGEPHGRNAQNSRSIPARGATAASAVPRSEANGTGTSRVEIENLFCPGNGRLILELNCACFEPLGFAFVGQPRRLSLRESCNCVHQVRQIAPDGFFPHCHPVLLGHAP